MEQIISENKRLREKVKTLEVQLDKLKRKQLCFTLIEHLLIVYLNL